MGQPAVQTEVQDTPQVDLERIRATYNELKKMQVKLDPNPIEYGPKRFNNRIARVRAMLNRVDQIFLQTSEDLHYFQRIINAKRTWYELEKRELMVNDPKCRVGRSQQEREALADVQLRAQIEEILGLQQAAHDLETLMVSIKSKRTDLKDAQGRMRDQMKLIEHDLGMGARWGGNAEPSELNDAVHAIDSMLDTVDKDFGISDEDEDEDDEAEEEEDDDDETDEDETDETPVRPEPEPPPPAPKAQRKKPQPSRPAPAAKETSPASNDEDDGGVFDFLKPSSEPGSEPEPEVADDPAPRVEDPVLTFGEEPEDGEKPAGADADLEAMLLGGTDPEQLPPDDHSSEAADDFLEGLDPDAIAEEPEGDEPEEGVGIDDLIASFADD